MDLYKWKYLYLFPIPSGDACFAAFWDKNIVRLSKTLRSPDGMTYLESTTRYHSLTFGVDVYSVENHPEDLMVVIYGENGVQLDNFSYAEIEDFFAPPVETTDNVNHPAHYQSRQGIEVIDVIGAFTEDLTGMEAVCTANALKYTCRWKHKNGVEDLKKAVWYLNKLIDIKSKEANSND